MVEEYVNVPRMGERTSCSIQCAMVIIELDSENEEQGQFNVSRSLTCVSFGKNWL